MRTRTAKQFVEIEGHARQIAEIFEQGEEGEENGHRRQHHRYHPRRGQVNAVCKQTREPPRGVHRHESIVYGWVHDAHQQLVEPVGRVVRADDGEPKHATQQGQHDGEPPDAVGKYAVELYV